MFSAGALNEALSTWQGEGGEVSHVPWARAQERGKDCVFFSFPNHAGPWSYPMVFVGSPVSRSIPTCPFFDPHDGLRLTEVGGRQ